MSKQLFILIIFSIIISKILSVPECKERENYCKKCNILTNLCLKCEYNGILIPDENGGCKGANTCEIGKNYCEECDSENQICKVCSKLYYPDENGGCSFTDGCEISYNGNCIKCKEDFVKIGKEDSIQICKSNESEDFKNCNSIDYNKGYCIECKENFYLNEGDKKCIETANCFESIFGKCNKCSFGFYLDHKDKNKCKSNRKDETENNQSKEGDFRHCSETEDGINCSQCEDGYYSDDEGKCVDTNFCLKSKNFICNKCIDGYQLTKKYNTCTKSENCYMADKDSGGCLLSSSGYYLDINDERKCKSNREEDDLKYCQEFNGICKKCEDNYYLDEGSKCTNTKFCANSEGGVCKKCSEKYYLGKDNKCSIVEHCIYSNSYSSCLECESGFYYNASSNICTKASGAYKNCKRTDYSKVDLCYECNEGFYIIRGDNYCYSNDDLKEGDALYKCSLANQNKNECLMCTNGYFLGTKDKKCTQLENCAISENDGTKTKCIECDEDYCLDVNTGKCEDNFWVTDIKKKFLYKCKKTTKDGEGCEECVEGYKLENVEGGVCTDFSECQEEKEGICVECKKGEFPFSFCANKDFGCVENSFNEFCLRCDDSLDFDNCTECKKGYKLSESAEWDGVFECIPEE